MDAPELENWQCKKCEHDCFVVARRCGGWWRTIYCGEVIDATDLGSMWYGEDPKTVTCENCGTRYPNPLLRVPS